MIIFRLATALKISSKDALFSAIQKLRFFMVAGKTNALGAQTDNIFAQLSVTT